MLLVEGRPVQFPNDVEVFLVAPPTLDDIRRWLRDRQEKARLGKPLHRKPGPPPPTEPE